MFFGSRLNRLATSIRRGISKYSVGSDNPGLVFDFIDNFYQKDKNQTVNFDGAITHARAGNATMTDGYGPELVTNGGFDSDSDWTLSNMDIEDGVLEFDTSQSTGTATQTLSMVVGKTYVLRFYVANRTQGNLYPRLGSFSNLDTLSSDANGWHEYIVNYDGSVNQIQLVTNVSFNGYIDNVSVREMPVLKWAPHNLVTYSEDFDPALSDWTLGVQGNGITPTLTLNYAIAPDGSNTAARLQVSRTTAGNADRSRIEQNVTYPQNVTLSRGVWIKSTDGSPQVIQVLDSSENNALNNVTVGADWQLVELSYPTILSAGGNFWIGLLNSQVSALTADVLIWGAHLYRSDLGGMVNNPDRGDSYVPTAAVASGDNIVVDGGFDDVTKWSLGTGWSISGSKLVGSNVGGTAYAQQNIDTTSGAYVVTFDVTDYTSGNLDVFVGGSSSSAIPITGTGSYSVVVTGVGTYTSTTVRLSAGNANFTGSIDNLVVRKSLVDPSAARYLPRIGHHVYNGSAWANEGLLAESEERVNEMTSANFTAGGGSISANNAVSPDGSQNAFRFTEDTASSSLHRIFKNNEGTDNVESCFSVYVKGNGRLSFSLHVFDADETTNNFTATFAEGFDKSGGSLTTNGNSTIRQSTVQNVGNGWYRLSVTGVANTSGTGGVVNVQLRARDSSNNQFYTGDGTSGFYYYGVQFEAGSTPSSYIPNESTTTRAAETFTIPSANLPWPTPQYIGDELVTNGTFDSDLSGWTDDNSQWAFSGSRAYHASSDVFGTLRQSLSVTAGKVYRIMFDYEVVSGQLRCEARDSSNSPNSTFNIKNLTGTGSADVVFVPDASFDSIAFARDDVGVASEMYVDSVSVREINPLSISIGMDGRITYADTGSSEEAKMFQWQADSNNYIRRHLATSSGRTGEFRFQQRESTSGYSAENSPYQTLRPDVLVPFNASSRHGSTFVNGAVDGVAFTEDTTPTALADLSATDLLLANKYIGTIGTFRVWDKDLGDAGLVEATNPSLEPSLSLTFEGVGTNSFVVNNWSE